MTGPRFAHLTGRAMWARCDHDGTRIEGRPAAVVLAPARSGDDAPAPVTPADYAAWQARLGSAVVLPCAPDQCTASRVVLVVPGDAPVVLGDAGWQALPAPPVWFVAAVGAFGVAVAVLSYYPVRNMASRRQRMNVSYNPFHLVNSYGAFGTVGRIRREVVLEGTADDDPDDAQWREYEFKGKPGAVDRRPAQWAPYHLRLDWLLWFAALSPMYAQPWREALLLRLLRNDPDTLALLRHNPFPDAPPRYVRALLYVYTFSDWHRLRTEHVWWQRELIGVYLPAVRLAHPDSSGGLRR